MIVMPTDARAQNARCVSPIMTCGCTIITRGFYKIGANLNFTQGLTGRSGCIDISASNVVLSAGIEGDGGFNITGIGGRSPAGIGVHVLSSSSNDLLELPSNIEGWNYGIEIDGNADIVQDFTAALNGMGIVLMRSSNNVVTSFTASANDDFGVWISGGANNQVRGGTLDANTTGLFMGCSPLGIVGRACNPSSLSNKISNLSVSANSYMGVILDFGNNQNIINGVASHDNRFFDLYDVNAGCGQNLWFFNFFTNSNQDCIE